MYEVIAHGTDRGPHGAPEEERSDPRTIESSAPFALEFLTDWGFERHPCPCQTSRTSLSLLRNLRTQMLLLSILDESTGLCCLSYRPAQTTFALQDESCVGLLETAFGLNTLHVRTLCEDTAERNLRFAVVTCSCTWTQRSGNRGWDSYSREVIDYSGPYGLHNRETQVSRKFQYSTLGASEP